MCVGAKDKLAKPLTDSLAGDARGDHEGKNSVELCRNGMGREVVIAQMHELLQDQTWIFAMMEFVELLPSTHALGIKFSPKYMKIYEAISKQIAIATPSTCTVEDVFSLCSRVLEHLV